MIQEEHAVHALSRLVKENPGIPKFPGKIIMYNEESIVKLCKTHAVLGYLTWWKQLKTIHRCVL